jgi:tetratricopeptide (TPR) repeat protein
VATAWAARRAGELSARADDNAEELLAIGRRYGIVSPATSMIVFETLSQWLEHDVEPPESLAEIHAKWAQRHPTAAQKAQREEVRRSNYMANLKREWASRVAWWENPIPPKPKTPKSGLFGGDGAARGAMNSFSRSASNARRSARFVEAEDSVPAVEMEVAFGAEPVAAAEAPVRLGHVVKLPKEKQSNAAAASISVKAWDPQTPYLTAIKDAKAALGPSGGVAYGEYMVQRGKYASSPAFYLDCGGWFFAQKENALAVRVLSNLAELRLDDPGMLRTYAWRLREAGEFDAALAVLRKVAKLRPEDPHSFRDLAIVFEERGRRDMSADDISNALANYHKAAFTAWDRDNGLWTAIVAVEELNALVAWSSRAKWPDGKAPKVPEYDAEFKKLLDLDVRIALSWDVDNTDVDLHVLEPDGEEAYYGHHRTSTGGLVSHDVTTGYGPEEYLKKSAPKGVYKVLANYFGSRQQTLVGPATVTATVFTNWGRPEEKRQTLSLRLEKPKDKVEIGAVTLE